MLSSGVSMVRGHFTEGRVILINRAMGVVLAVFAVWAFTSGFAGWLGYKVPPG
jgi:hypothetical protein